jgi:hypothetical protein
LATSANPPHCGDAGRALALHLQPAHKRFTEGLDVDLDQSGRANLVEEFIMGWPFTSLPYS